MKRITIILLVSLLACVILCLFGSVLSMLFIPGQAPAQSIPVQIQPTEPYRLERDKIAIVFQSLGFHDWQYLKDYWSSTRDDGHAKIILYDNPVTKASLVLDYDVGNGGQLIGKLLSTTGTDPAAMDWITRHIDGGGSTRIGETNITVTDDTEAGRVIIELTR